MPQNTSYFFLIVPPGLEKLSLLEFEQKCLQLELIKEECKASITTGGVLLQAPLQYASRLCEYLKIPTRILLRIDEFKASDGPRFFQKFSKIQWNQYLRGHLPQLHISASASRLFDSRKIEKAANQALKGHFAQNPTKEKYILDPGNAQVFIRISKDVATISIALDGERLDKRGYKLQTHIAPMRENLAAALLLSAKMHYPNIDKLIDPMCGSGSFALEALSFFNKIHRDIYVSKLPLFLKMPQLKNISNDQMLYHFISLFDRDQQCLDYAKENLETQNILPSLYKIQKADIFKTDLEKSPQSGIILNPPYGQRIKIKGPLNKYYQKLIKTLFETFSPVFIGIIIPEEVVLSEKEYKIKNIIRFKNGGLKVRFYLLDKPESLH